MKNIKGIAKIILLIIVIAVTILNCICAYKIVNAIHDKINQIIDRNNVNNMNI